MAKGKWFYYFVFIAFLILLGGITKILPIIGIFLIAAGIILFLYSSNDNDQQGAMWGAIIIAGGIAIISLGNQLFAFFQEIGMIDFLKTIFGKSP